MYQVNKHGLTLPIELTGIPFFVFVVDEVPIQTVDGSHYLRVPDYIVWLEKEIAYVKETFATPVGRIAIEYYRQSLAMHRATLRGYEETPDMAFFENIQPTDAFKAAARAYVAARDACEKQCQGG